MRKRTARYGVLRRRRPIRAGAYDYFHHRCRPRRSSATGVIGECEQPGIRRQAPRLFKRIGFERRAIFQHRGRICEVTQGTNSNRQSAEKRLHLGKLA